MTEWLNWTPKEGRPPCSLLNALSSLPKLKPIFCPHGFPFTTITNFKKMWLHIVYSFCFCVLLLSLMPLIFIRVVCVRSWFLSVNELFSNVCLCHNYFFHSRVAVHLSFSQFFLATVSKNVMNICIQDFFVWMWELDYKESWALKNWCISTVVLQKTLESPLDCKEIQPVHPKGNQSWIFMEGLNIREFMEGLMLKLKLLMQRGDSLKKILMLERLRVGGEGDDRG